jgi:hypothetical protein
MVKLCKALTNRGLVYSAKARISNNMLYVRYVHLTKDANPSSNQRGCYIRIMTAMVQFKKKSLVVSLEGLGAKTN